MHGAQPGRPGTRDPLAADGGFTLMEVVVAMALLAVVATAGLTAGTRGLAASAGLQRRQVAVALANQAMEQVRATPAAPVTVTHAGTTSAVSSLVRGRSPQAVAEQWAASSAPQLAATDQAGGVDPVGDGVPAVVPLTSAQTVSGQRYTTRVLIGTCVRALTGGTSTCDRASAAPSAPMTVFRVVVEVVWSSSGAGCDPTGCAYRLVTLVDPHTDLQWLDPSATAPSTASTP